MAASGRVNIRAFEQSHSQKNGITSDARSASASDPWERSVMAVAEISGIARCFTMASIRAVSLVTFASTKSHSIETED